MSTQSSSIIRDAQIIKSHKDTWIVLMTMEEDTPTRRVKQSKIRNILHDAAWQFHQEWVINYNIEPLLGCSQ